MEEHLKFKKIQIEEKKKKMLRSNITADVCVEGKVGRECSLRTDVIDIKHDSLHSIHLSLPGCHHAHLHK